MNYYLEHKSQYTGGFIKTNGRTNNSSKYNHDYYIHNIHKWKKSKRYKNNENDKNDDWQQAFEEAEREARKRNPGYQPPEDVDDFEVMLLEMGYDTTKHSQDELNKMFLMSKKNNRRMKHMNIYSSELYHHGIKGQKWGQRRFQYDNGDYTPEGKRRYGFGLGTKNRGAAYTNMKNKKAQYKIAKAETKAKKEYKNSDEYKERKAKRDKMLKTGLKVAAGAAVAYGAYKLYSRHKDTKEMKRVNAEIEKGRKRVEEVYNSKLLKGALESSYSARYLGNDLKYHTATKTLRNNNTHDYTNYHADTQQLFNSLKDYRNAKKRSRR